MGSNSTIRLLLGTIGTFARTNGPTDSHQSSIACNPGHEDLDVAVLGSSLADRRENLMTLPEPREGLSWL